MDFPYLIGTFSKIKVLFLANRLIVNDLLYGLQHFIVLDNLHFSEQVGLR
jgi:hypothetical protein